MSEAELRRLAHERVWGSPKEADESEAEPEGWIDEATDLLYTTEGEAAVEECKRFAEENRKRDAQRQGQVQMTPTEGDKSGSKPAD